MFLFKRLKYALLNFWTSLKQTDMLTEHLTADEIRLVMDAELHTKCPCCEMYAWKLNTEIFRMPTRNIHFGKSVYMLTCYNCNFVLMRPYMAHHQVMSQKRTHAFIQSTKKKVKFKPYVVKRSKPTAE